MQGRTVTFASVSAADPDDDAIAVAEVVEEGSVETEESYAVTGGQDRTSGDDQRGGGKG